MTACQTFIFSDTAVPLQSAEQKCQDITMETEPNCILEKLAEFHNCPIKNTYQFGACNPPKRDSRNHARNNEYDPNNG